MRRGRFIGVAVAGLAVLGMLGTLPTHSAAFCSAALEGPQPVPWVERQLRELPKIRELADGSLSVGRALDIRERGVRGNIVVNGGPVGYEFSPFLLLHAPLTLGWRVAIRLVRLKPGARGEEEELVAFRRRRIGTAPTPKGRSPVIGVRVPDERGIFRVDLFIRNRQGRFLGRVGRYLIGADPVYDVRLDTDLAVYSPGDYVLSEVENLGTQSIVFSEIHRIEREVDGQWVRFERTGPISIGGTAEGYLGPGQIGGCSSARLLRDTPPGSYRAVRASVKLWRSEDDDSRITLTAPFRVE